MFGNYVCFFFFFFFFNDTATTEIYTFPYTTLFRSRRKCFSRCKKFLCANRSIACRSEEHTSELQSRSDLVCRLLLEKKKKKYLSLQEKKRMKKKTTTDLKNSET